MCTVTLYIGTVVGRYTALCVHRHRGVVSVCMGTWADRYIIGQVLKRVSQDTCSLS